MCALYIYLYILKQSIFLLKFEISGSCFFFCEGIQDDENKYGDSISLLTLCDSLNYDHIFKIIFVFPIELVGFYHPVYKTFID